MKIRPNGLIEDKKEVRKQPVQPVQPDDFRNIVIPRICVFYRC